MRRDFAAAVATPSAQASQCLAAAHQPHFPHSQGTRAGQRKGCNRVSKQVEDSLTLLCWEADSAYDLAVTAQPRPSPVTLCRFSLRGCQCACCCSTVLEPFQLIAPARHSSTAALQQSLQLQKAHQERRFRTPFLLVGSACSRPRLPALQQSSSNKQSHDAVLLLQAITLWQQAPCALHVHPQNHMRCLHWVRVPLSLT